MSANRRFFAVGTVNAIFRFKVDTRLVNVGATDGSQNNLAFNMPFGSISGDSNFILRVNDGRPDVPVSGQEEINLNRLLHFATAGIYTIELIGVVSGWSFYTSIGQTYDLNKIIEIKSFGGLVLGRNQFRGCKNLIINIKEPFVLPTDSYGLFFGIKAVQNNISLFDVTKCTNATAIFQGIQHPLSSALNPFFKSMLEFDQVYTAVSFSDDLLKIEVFSDTIHSVLAPLNNSKFRGRIVFKTPNLKTIYRMCWGYNNPPALGGVDIRNVTSWSQGVSHLMSKQNVDATIIEWATGYDWSGIPTVTNKVNINFYQDNGVCYCSNSPQVLSAKTFLESKGISFPYLVIQ